MHQYFFILNMSTLILAIFLSVDTTTSFRSKYSSRILPIFATGSGSILTHTASNLYKHIHLTASIKKNISVFKIRFKDRPVRKLFLRRDLQLLTIPPLTYIPLGNSTDSVQVIRRCIHSEGIAFNTKGTQRVYTVSGSFHSTTSTITTFETYIDEVRLPFCNISNKLFFTPNETLPVLQPLVLLRHDLPPPPLPLSLTFSTLYVHTTAARCPALILFELEEHPMQTDLATFLEAELDKYSEEDVGKHKTLRLIPYIFLQTSYFLHFSAVRSDIRIVTYIYIYIP